ncbi:unnamed protein product [Dovyalis caffra]|uniref:HTH hxlR-type domain-containing protein n=1 Tax=Dovyalis caffra TaxID=77055 RepID=A0AAV1RRK4_9ROSI|nr:unnamed protein product [Dovyalis caffra]
MKSIDGPNYLVNYHLSQSPITRLKALKSLAESGHTDPKPPLKSPQIPHRIRYTLTNQANTLQIELQGSSWVATASIS